MFQMIKLPLFWIEICLIVDLMGIARLLGIFENPVLYKEVLKDDAQCKWLHLKLSALHLIYICISNSYPLKLKILHL